ncbi:hypothetical protein [Mangrovicoccus algicola]|uniref:Uncharacterized protein n=1 Tax=Mangrovicoccus algicola TaxID=2771008 RepID=A0A8J6YQP9_9RHOB|nr:hypothetical protein [Mangrovicoccus algicola]MBE3637803.1 hypothetical protein [Mangrovicoccus algicola]
MPAIPLFPVAFVLLLLFAPPAGAQSPAEHLPPSFRDPGAVYFPVAEIAPGLERACLAVAREQGHDVGGFDAPGFIQHDLGGRLFRPIWMRQGGTLWCHADLGVGRVEVTGDMAAPAGTAERPRLPQFDGRKLIAYDSRWLDPAERACAGLAYARHGRPRLTHVQNDQSHRAGTVHVMLSVAATGDGTQPIAYCAFDTLEGSARLLPDPGPALRDKARATFRYLRPMLRAQGESMSSARGPQAAAAWLRAFDESRFQF